MAFVFPAIYPLPPSVLPLICCTTASNRVFFYPLFLFRWEMQHPPCASNPEARPCRERKRRRSTVPLVSLPSTPTTGVRFCSSPFRPFFAYEGPTDRSAGRTLAICRHVKPLHLLSLSIRARSFQRRQIARASFNPLAAKGDRRTCALTCVPRRANFNGKHSCTRLPAINDAFARKTHAIIP